MMPFGCCKNRPVRKKGQENDCAKPCAIFKQGRKDTKKTGKAQTNTKAHEANGKLRFSVCLMRLVAFQRTNGKARLGHLFFLL